MVIGRFPSMTVEEARKIARLHRTHVDSGGNPSLERQTMRSAPTMSDMIDYYTGEYAKTRDLNPVDYGRGISYSSPAAILPQRLVESG